MAPARKKDFATAFGEALDAQLTKRGLRQSDLARETGVTSAYINKVMRSSTVSPEWVDLISDTLKLQDADRGRLHVAAAVTKGYRVDLVPEVVETKPLNRKRPV